MAKERTRRSGFSLVEVMIIMGVMSTASLYISEGLYRNSAAGKRISLRGDWKNLIDLMRVVYSDETTCSATFGATGRANVIPPLASIMFLSGSTSVSVPNLVQIIRSGSSYTNQGTFLEVGVAKGGIQATSIDLVKLADKGTITRKVDGVDVTRKAYDVRLQIKAVRVVTPVSSTSSSVPSGAPSGAPVVSGDLTTGTSDSDPSMIRLTIFTHPTTEEIMECSGAASNISCPDIDNQMDIQSSPTSVSGHFGHNHKTCQVNTLYLNPMGALPTTRIVMGDPYPLTSPGASPSGTNSNIGQITYDSGTAQLLNFSAPNVSVSLRPNSTAGTIKLHPGTGPSGRGVYLFGSDRIGGALPLRINTDVTGMTYGVNTWGRMLRFDDTLNGSYDFGISDATRGSSFYITKRNSVPSPNPALAIHGRVGNVLINSMTEINTYMATPTPTPTPSNPFELQVNGDVYTTGALQLGPFPESSGSPRSSILINGAALPMNTNTPYPNVSPTAFPSTTGPNLKLQSRTGSYGQVTHSSRHLYIDNFSTVTGLQTTYINAYGGDGIYFGSLQKPQDVRLVGTLTLTPGGSRPACNATVRGRVYIEQVAGKDDRPQMCVRNSDGNYQWKGLLSAFERVCCSEIESYSWDVHPCNLECPEGMKIREISIAYGHTACNNLPTCAQPYVTPLSPFSPSKCPNQNPPEAGCVGKQSCTYTFFNDESWCTPNCQGFCGVDTCPGNRKTGVIVAVCEY